MEFVWQRRIIAIERSCALAMAEDAPFLPGLSPVAGKAVHVDFEGGRLTSDGGALVLAEIERKLGVADRLAGCIDALRDDPAFKMAFGRLLERGAKLCSQPACPG